MQYIMTVVVQERCFNDRGLAGKGGSSNHVFDERRWPSAKVDEHRRIIESPDVLQTIVIKQKQPRGCMRIMDLLRAELCTLDFAVC